MASSIPPQNPLAFTLEDNEDGYDYTTTYIRRTKEARIRMLMSDVPDEELDESRLWTQEECQSLRFRNLSYKDAFMTYGKSTNKTRWLRAKGFSPQRNKDKGLFPAMSRVRPLSGAVKDYQFSASALRKRIWHIVGYVSGKTQNQ